MHVAPATSLVLQRAAVATTAAGMFALTGCGAAPPSLTTQPHDHNSGRALAEAVAASADCGAVEDDGLAASDHWDFTCQTGSHMFLIRTASSAAVLSVDRPAVARTGPFYVVSPFSTPAGGASAASLLARFPGDPAA